MLGLLWLLFVRLPTSFLPVEDQGQVMVQVTLPAGAKSSRTSAAVDQIQNYFTNDEKDNVDFIFVTQGFSFAGQGENTAQGFVSLAPLDKRSEEHTSELQSLMRISYAVLCLNTKKTK